MDPSSDSSPHSAHSVPSGHGPEFDALYEATKKQILNLSESIAKEGNDFGALLEIIKQQIECVNEYKINSKFKQLTVTSEKMATELIGNYFDKRDVAMLKAESETINGFINVLEGLKPYFEFFISHSVMILEIGYYNILPVVLADKLMQLFDNFKEEMFSLHSCFKSPYNFKLIADNLSQDIGTKPNCEMTKHVQAFIGLIIEEIKIIRGAEGTSDMQRKVLTIHFDKIITLRDKFASDLLSSADADDSMHKPAEKVINTDRMKETIVECYKIIYDTTEAMELFKSVDLVNESASILELINEKKESSFDDVYNYMENVKTQWMTTDIINETNRVCTNALLKRITEILKKMEKLSLIKDQLESCLIVFVIQKLADNVITLEEQFTRFHDWAFFLAYPNVAIKPKINPPEGLIRDDPIYEDLHADPTNCLLIVYKHITEHISFLDGLTWNCWQERKPRKKIEYLHEICSVLRSSLRSLLDGQELFQLSMDLADRYLMTKRKIEYDRNALEYRFSFAPQKIDKFSKFYDIPLTFEDKFWGPEAYLRELAVSEFDTIVNELQSKVKNRVQLILVEKAKAMMKRSINCLNLIRWPDNFSNEEYENEKKILYQHAVNEYCYAAEIVDHLLDIFESNQRIPDCFNANGHFIKQIDSVGLKVKDDFNREVDSQIKLLEKTIKEKEANLEPVEEEKIQLGYLVWIYSRSNSIPINELELAEQDQVKILREIIEEYEYTMEIYGSAHQL